MTPQQKIGTLVAMTVFGMVVGGALPLVFNLARRRRQRAATAARRLLLVLGLYAAVLVATSLLTPRHVLAPGQPDCYGDWCVAGGQAARLATGSARCGPASGPVWHITLEIFTQSWASPKRASSATVAAIEDRHGLQYAPCGEAGAETAPLARHLGVGLRHSRIIPHFTVQFSLLCSSETPWAAV